MAQRTLWKDIFDFDSPITFCFNLRRSFSHFLLIGFFCSFYLAKSAGFFTLFFCSLWVLFLIQFVFYPFFLTWQLVCCLERQLRCVKMWSCVHYAVCKCYVLCASAVCCVLCAMWKCCVQVLCAVCYVLCWELCEGAMCYVPCAIHPVENYVKVLCAVCYAE